MHDPGRGCFASLGIMGLFLVDIVADVGMDDISCSGFGDRAEHVASSSIFASDSCFCLLCVAR